MTREEAIKVVYGIPVTKAQHEALQFLIPELVVSEDERMCKAALEGIEYLERELCWDAIGDTDILDVKDYLEKQKKQKPIEWSEEDEKIAKEIEEELWYPGDFPDYPSKEESKLYDDCQRRLDWFKNKLKSLRPQPYTVSIKDTIKFGNLEYERGVKDGIQSEKNRQWKPSEEQMKQLKSAADLPEFGPMVTTRKQFPDLESLYEHFLRN